MISFETKNIEIHYNSDYSGIIRIIDKNSGDTISIRAEELLQFISTISPLKRGK